jgi:hypothetical protein
MKNARCTRKSKIGYFILMSCVKCFVVANFVFSNICKYPIECPIFPDIGYYTFLLGEFYWLGICYRMTYKLNIMVYSYAVNILYY